jgi:hypothetical protein
MRDFEAAANIQQPDLSRVGETLRALTRGLRGPGATDEAPSFADALAAAGDGRQTATDDSQWGGRQTGDVRTPDSIAMSKRSRDTARGGMLRTTLTPPAATVRPAATTTATSTTAASNTSTASASAVSTATVPVTTVTAARGTEASSTRANDPSTTAATSRVSASEGASSSTRATDPVSAQPTARTTAPEVVQVSPRVNDPGTVQTSGRVTAAETTTATTAPTRTNDPISAPSSGRASVSEGPTTGAATDPLALKDYPRPAKDRSGVLNWTSTTPPTDDETSSLIDEAKQRQVGWVTFSVDPSYPEDYENLAQRLNDAVLQPIARIQDTEGDLPATDVANTVKDLRSLGVKYYQLFDGGNVAAESPDAKVDVSNYADRWLKSAQAVIANGGLPGIGALAPKGDKADYDDLGFMRQLMSTIKDKGGQDVMGHAWMAMRGTTPGGTATSGDTDTVIKRAGWYDRVARHALGQSIPILATSDPTGHGEQLSTTSTNTDASSTADQAERALRNSRRQTPALFAASRGSLESARV